MTPPASIARSDLIAADERLHEDGVRTGHILVDVTRFEDNPLNVDISDESTITFRKQSVNSTFPRDTRLDLDRTCAGQSGVSGVADAVEIEHDGRYSPISSSEITIEGHLTTAGARSRPPHMGKLSLIRGTSKNKLKTRPSSSLIIATPQDRVNNYPHDTLSDGSGKAWRHHRGQSTDSDDGEEAAPPSARRVEARDRAAATRCHLEYAVSVWNPHRLGLIEDMEKVQKRATKLIRECKNLPYKDRLNWLNLPSLKYRRIRGDMIEVFKILNALYDVDVLPPLIRNLDSRTRGNSLKLKVTRCKYDVRKFSFCNRVVNIWNALPEYVVSSVALNSFKNNLDKHWKGALFHYDFKASPPGFV